jgi:uncharacterized protein (TIGR02246 family)
MKLILSLCMGVLMTTTVLADPATRARAHSEAFAQAMNARNVDEALALYSNDARVIWPGEGEEAQGKTAIRLLIESTLRGFPKDSRLALHSQDAIALGDGFVATVSHWEQTYTRGDGTKVIATFRATEVIRVDGGATLYVLDHASAGLRAPGSRPPPASR